MLKRKHLYFIVPIIVILFILPLLKVEYATDTYASEWCGFEYIAHHMQNTNGRVVMAWFFAFCNAIIIKNKYVSKYMKGKLYHGCNQKRDIHI